MAVTDITSAISGGLKSTDANKRSDMTRDQFFQVLIAELKGQDPLAPMDNTQFLQQMAQIHTLEATSALTDGIQGLLQFQEMASAASLIGKTVTGISDSGESITGVVEKVQFSGGEAKLSVGGAAMSLGNVNEIINPIAA